MSRLMKINENGIFAMEMKYVLRGLLTLLLTIQMGLVGAVEKITYYHNDALGSPVAATDQNGNLLWREAYRPYGSRLRGEDGGTNNVWYTGKQEDSGTGLSYFGARWYDPNIGRFMAIDPVGFKESNIHSFNRYAYANNNPYKFIDPDGRESKVVGKNIIINPENKSVPSLTIPNVVGAKGVSTSDFWFHEYNFSTPSNLSLSQAGSGIKNDPTPGYDSPASAAGTLNDAGAISIFPGPNLVVSFVVASPDPNKYSDITVNYTVSGQHTLDEGFVIRYGENDGAGGTILRSYGEGNAFKQDIPFAKYIAGRAWRKNSEQIIKNAK